MSAELASGSVNPETLYTKQQCIGGGSFGKVYKGIDRRTGKVVAIKIVDMENAEDEVDDIITEIAMLSGMNSQYVTQYYGSFMAGSDLWIVMEFCSGGSCADLMKPGPLSEGEIAVILKELLNGLVYLHDDHKLHRDIKAANILVSHNGQVKLADFGVSGQLSATMTKKNTFVGTPFWMAPEVIKQSGYDSKADIWSTGITALELAMREPPYADIHPMKVLFLIPKNPPPTLQGEWSPAFKDFVSQCLKKDPRERPTAKQLLEHPFMRKAGKAARLQPLIARYQEWQLRNPKQEESSDETTPQKRKPVNEDLWDFGTVRPLKTNSRGTTALSPITAAGANARNVSPPRKPVPDSGDENVNADIDDTVRMSPLSPTKLAANIPLPVSPDKAKEVVPLLPSNRYQPSSLTKKSAVPALFSPGSPTKGILSTPQRPSPQQGRRITPLARDYDDYLQRSIAADMEAMELSINAEPTPTRASVLPRLNLDIPPYKARGSGVVANPESYLNEKPHDDKENKNKEKNGMTEKKDKALLDGADTNGKTSSKLISSTGRRSKKALHSDNSPASQPAMVQLQKPLPPLGHIPIASESTQLPLSGVGLTIATLEGQKPLPPFSPPNSKVSVSRPGSSATNKQAIFGSWAPRGSNPGSPVCTSPAMNTPVDVPEWTTGSPQSPTAPTEITALHGVVVPALEAAVARRAHQISAKNREESKNAFKDPTGFLERRKERNDAHENVKKIVRRVIEDLKMLDLWDAKSPVGMGGGVTNFLEGFLEEVLVRVEPSDD
ncbi:Pkinase-domain-containing protein [Westerdykella ornata]|uniref:non-specific serine/threonine protein kinase n=1 Tax=Westerdykella ornata TaxID=318751 RepID=A0A6A6K088_WESOR|nr:Pkinase-domain-containing protein [Westerdykella ornata]KAF2280759.1 Pkinase-domain-containing protein [Westerdykella ornata]